MNCINLLCATIICISLFCEIIFTKKNILVSPCEGKTKIIFIYDNSLVSRKYKFMKYIDGVYKFIVYNYYIYEFIL